MIFTETPLAGAYTIDTELRRDDRGFFARAFCRNELAGHGMDFNLAQANSSFNRQAGTLRGMHYQLDPRAETKIVRCTRGAVYDVVLDLRRDSKTYQQHFGLILSEENRKSLYVPKGFAHGFYTLEDNSELFYLVDEFYSPDLERGVRWNDPLFAISWPGLPTVVSARDASYADFASQP